LTLTCEFHVMHHLHHWLSYITSRRSFALLYATVTHIQSGGYKEKEEGGP